MRGYQGHFGARVIRVCEQMGALAKLPAETSATRPAPARSKTAADARSAARILVLGGAGFIGKELVRQLVASGRGVRLLVRSAASLPEALRAQVDCQTGDLLEQGNSASRHGRYRVRRAPGAGQRQNLGRLPEAGNRSHAAGGRVRARSRREAIRLRGHDRFVLCRPARGYDHGSHAARPAHRAQESLCPRQSGLRRDFAADAARAGIAAGDHAAGNRDRPRWQPVPLGRGHVVARRRVPDLGRRHEQAAAGAGGRRGARADCRHGEAGHRGPDRSTWLRTRA